MWNFPLNEIFEGKMPTAGSSFTARESVNDSIRTVCVLPVTSPNVRYSESSGGLIYSLQRGKLLKYLVLTAR